jgi:hypothetical protein
VSVWFLSTSFTFNGFLVVELDILYIEFDIMP